MIHIPYLKILSDLKFHFEIVSWHPDMIYHRSFSHSLICNFPQLSIISNITTVSRLTLSRIISQHDSEHMCSLLCLQHLIVWLGALTLLHHPYPSSTVSLPWTNNINSLITWIQLKVMSVYLPLHTLVEHQTYMSPRICNEHDEARIVRFLNIIKPTT